MQNLSNKAEQLKGLGNGKGIQYLLDKAYKIFGNPILIHDMEFKVIDFNQDVVTDDPIWNEYAATGTISSDWLIFIKNECFLEEAANAKKITILTSDKLKHDRIFGKLFNKNNIQIGCAVMVYCEKPFEDDDLVLFDKFCTILSTEFGKSKFYNDYGQAYFEKLLSELIAGVDDIELYAAHVESIYMHLKTNLYLAVVDTGKCDDTYARLPYYRDLLKKAQPEYTYAVYQNYIVIIIGTDDQTLYVEKDLGKLNRIFRKNNIYAGISKPFENLFDLNKHFNEALGALSKGLAASSQRIFFA